MRVNIYAEEMTDQVELIEKTTADGTFVGVRFWLELPVTTGEDDQGQPINVRGPFMHRPGDDDSAAVTFWGKAQLKVALRKALDLLEAHGGERDTANARAEALVDLMQEMVNRADDWHGPVASSHYRSDLWKRMHLLCARPAQPKAETRG